MADVARPKRTTGKRRHDEASAEPAPEEVDASAEVPPDLKLLHDPEAEVAAGGAEADGDELLGFDEMEGDAELRYACEVEGCGLTFVRHGNLLRHERVVHRGERPLTCDKCDKTFAYKADLVIHDRSHTGERPFACTEEGCTKAYAYRSTLNVHMRTHTGERPYACYIEGCTKTFVRPSKLSRHVREVHGNGEKPFVCEVEGCGAAFVRRSKLRRHEIDVHAVIPKDLLGDGAGVMPLSELLGADAGPGREDLFLLDGSGGGGGSAGPEAAAAAAVQLKKAFACDVVGCDASFKSRSGLKSHTAKAHTVV